MVTAFADYESKSKSLFETSVQFRMKVIGAETQADLEVQHVDQFK